MDYQWSEYISKLAYYKWLAAGCPAGQEHADNFWFEAEKEFYETLKSQNNNGPFPGID